MTSQGKDEQGTRDCRLSRGRPDSLAFFTAMQPAAETDRPAPVARDADHGPAGGRSTVSQACAGARFSADGQLTRSITANAHFPVHRLEPVHRSERSGRCRPGLRPILPPRNANLEVRRVPPSRRSNVGDEHYEVQHMRVLRGRSSRRTASISCSAAMSTTTRRGASFEVRPVRPRPLGRSGRGRIGPRAWKRSQSTGTF